jgi:hypothetical protein
MHHRILCKHPTVLTEQNKKEVLLILKEMIKPDAPKKYEHYSKYQDLLDALILQIHEINHIENYPAPDNSVPPFIEEDKTLVVKPKTTSILELFSKVKVNKI